MDAVTSNMLPDTPPHSVILQYALSDAQVSWLGCYTLARSMGAVVFKNNVVEQGETLYGFPVIEEGSTTELAVMQGYDYGAPPAPNTNTPPAKDDDTHSCPRRDPRAQKQMDHFYNTGGVVIDFCEGQGCHAPDPPLSGSCDFTTS